MIVDLIPAPQGIFEIACGMISDLPATAAPGMTIAQVPIPVHRLRAGGNQTWDPCVPLIGWAFPVFRGPNLAHIAIVAADGSSPIADHTVHEAGVGTIIHEAFNTAIDVGEACGEPCLFRLVQVPGVVDAFWLAGEHDTFVDFEVARVASGPEFVSMIDPASDPVLEALRRLEGGSEDEHIEDSQDG